MSLAELHKLSVVEKLKINEVLWGDLVSNEASFYGLPCHETELVLDDFLPNAATE